MNSSFAFSLAWLWLMAVTAQVVLALIGFDPQIRLYFSNAVMLSTSTLAALICLFAARALPQGSPLRTGWMLISAGIAGWAIGQLIFFSYPLLHAGLDTPYPSAADIGFLLTSPLIALGLIVFHRSAGLSAPRWGTLLAAALFFVGGYWCYDSNVGGMFTGDAWLSLASIGYALTDPILLAVTVYVASSFKAGTTMSRAWWLVTAGVVLMLFGNQTYSYLVFLDTYATGSIIDVSWTVGFGLMALSAFYMRASMR